MVTNNKIENEDLQSKYYISLPLDQYYPRERGSCSHEDNLHGRYSSLQDAKVECNRDIRCIGVEDHDCQNVVFHVCKNSYKKPAERRACIDEKHVVTGTIIYIF